MTFDVLGGGEGLLGGLELVDALNHRLPRHGAGPDGGGGGGGASVGYMPPPAGVYTRPLKFTPCNRHSPPVTDVRPL